MGGFLAGTWNDTSGFVMLNEVNLCSICLDSSLRSE